MAHWIERPREEAALFAPSFCAALLWSAAAGHFEQSQTHMRFDLSFLVLPLTLRKATRERLPRTVKTSLPAWLSENTQTRAHIVENARALTPFSREALMFGSLHGAIQFVSGNVLSRPDWKARVGKLAKSTSDEVKDCISKASLVGKWLAAAGGPSTVMVMFGVRP